MVDLSICQLHNCQTMQKHARWSLTVFQKSLYDRVENWLYRRDQESVAMDLAVFNSNPTTTSQYAAIEVYNGPQEAGYARSFESRLNRVPTSRSDSDSMSLNHKVLLLVARSDGST